MSLFWKLHNPSSKTEGEVQFSNLGPVWTFWTISPKRGPGSKFWYIIFLGLIRWVYSENCIILAQELKETVIILRPFRARRTGLIRCRTNIISKSLSDGLEKKSTCLITISLFWHQIYLKLKHRSSVLARMPARMRTISALLYSWWGDEGIYES